MNNYNTAICIVGICLVITALVILINHLRTKKTIDTIENMLNQAVKGDFSEKSFDETRLRDGQEIKTNYYHDDIAWFSEVYFIRVLLQRRLLLLMFVQNQIHVP